MSSRRILALGTALVFAFTGSTALADDTDQGEKIFKKRCKTCHTLEQGGKHRMGPNLFGIFGAKAGATDFTKYKALKGSDVVWDDETLDAFLADPSGFAGGRISMVALKKAEARAEVIEYLKTVK